MFVVNSSPDSADNQELTHFKTSQEAHTGESRVFTVSLSKIKL